jgi:hypothetical protein
LDSHFMVPISAYTRRYNNNVHCSVTYGKERDKYMYTKVHTPQTAVSKGVLIQGATSPVIPGWTLALDIIPTAMCFLR